MLDVSLADRPGEQTVCGCLETVQIGCFRDQIGPTCNTEMSSRSLLSDGDGPGGTSGSSRRCPGPRRHLGLADPAAGDPASNQMASRRHFRSRRSTRPCQVSRQPQLFFGDLAPSIRASGVGTRRRQPRATSGRASTSVGGPARRGCSGTAPLVRPPRRRTYACPEPFLGVPSPAESGSRVRSDMSLSPSALSFPGSQDVVGTGGRTAAAGRIWPGTPGAARRAPGRCAAKHGSRARPPRDK